MWDLPSTTENSQIPLAFCFNERRFELTLRRNSSAGNMKSARRDQENKAAERNQGWELLPGLEHLALA